VSSHIFASASWYRALMLSERAAVLRNATRLSDIGDGELGRRELEAWRSQSPFDRGDWFARRLAQDGLDEDLLLAILTIPIERLHERSRTPLPWLEELERAYQSHAQGSARAPAKTGWTARVPAAAFLVAVEPLIQRACEGLRARTATIAGPFDARASDRLFIDRLLATFVTQLERVCVLEMNVARLEGRLAGVTPTERFSSFLQHLRDPDNALRLLADYPVLARSLVRCARQWELTSSELLAHLAADWDSIRTALSPHQDPGLLVGVAAGAGDAHRGGRSVAILEFASGLRVVYKPRSLALDSHFQDFLTWLNEHGADPPLRTLWMLDRSDHGFVEFVTPAPCQSHDEIARFYRRQGASIALVHVLAGVDMHFENLIAVGEHPCLVDLETLFHPLLPQAALPDVDATLVRDVTSESVLRTGLLPSRAWSQGEDAGVDLSGLGNEIAQLTPDALLHWQGEGTDAMHAARARVPLPPGKNLPALGDTTAMALDHLDDLERGFRDTWRLLARERARLSSAEGPLARFANDRARVVLRPTRAYGLLHSELSHPDLQRDALELERVLNKLWVGIDAVPAMMPVLASERDDLVQGDLPLFTTHPSSHDLEDSRGRRLAGFFAQSGLQLARRRLVRLDEVELERQLWFVRSAFATAAVTPQNLRWPSYRPIAPPQSVAPETLRARLIQAASRIGDRLASLALQDSAGHAAWIGFQFEGGRWQLVPLPDDLYCGIPGVVHFLAYLGDVTAEERHASLARAALRPVLERWRTGRCPLGTIGAFNGLGGLVYGLAHWSSLWSDASLLMMARAIAEHAGSRIDSDEDLDIIGGAAGLIPSLISLHKLDQQARWIELARRCGERLLARAEHLSSGVGWRTRLGGDLPATGFSHGAAGISWALAQLMRLTGDPRYGKVARAAVQYEATQFDEVAQNWLDPGGQRQDRLARDSTLMVAWCYGAPGIGLARLGLYDLDYGESVARDLAIATATTRAHGFGRNHSLCHGDLGNLDFLAQVARAQNDSELARFVERQSSAILESIGKDGALCGMPLGVESVALMNGLAGIGFGLLRLARPERVPTVLGLAPPR
jgi:type 2 lantibiotic biosynthesis protein LanM